MLSADFPSITKCSFCSKPFRTSTPGERFGLMDSFLVPACTCVSDRQMDQDLEATRKPAWAKSLSKLHYPFHTPYRDTHLDIKGWVRKDLRTQLKVGAKLYYGGPHDIGKSETLYTLAADALWFGVKVRGGQVGDLLEDLKDFKKAAPLWDELRDASILILDGLATFQLRTINELRILHRLVETFDAPGRSIWIASQVEGHSISKLKLRIANFSLDEQMVAAVNSIYSKVTRNMECRGVKAK